MKLMEKEEMRGEENLRLLEESEKEEREGKKIRGKGKVNMKKSVKIGKVGVIKKWKKNLMM